MRAQCVLLLALAAPLLAAGRSGQIHSVGYTLYMDMLERAVESLKNGEIPDPELSGVRETEVNLRIPALIPDDYLPDINTRLVLYKRISMAAGDSDLRDIQVEMIDRFGLLPEPAKNLFMISGLKLTAAPMGIRKIEVGSESGRILFGEEPNIDAGKLVELVQTRPDEFRLEGGNKLRISGDFSTKEERFRIVSDMLALLSTPDNQLKH